MSLRTQRGRWVVWVIVLSKLLRALVCGAIACGLLVDPGNPAQQIIRVVDFIGADPKGSMMSDMLAYVRTLAAVELIWFAAALLVYSALNLIQAVGLVYRQGWAASLTIAQAGIFIAFEIFKLAQGFTWTVLGILIGNVAIVAYLIWGRAALTAPRRLPRDFTVTNSEPEPLALSADRT